MQPGQSPYPPDEGTVTRTENRNTGCHREHPLSWACWEQLFLDILPRLEEYEFSGICGSVYFLNQDLNFLDGGSAKKVCFIFG